MCSWCSSPEHHPGGQKNSCVDTIAGSVFEASPHNSTFQSHFTSLDFNFTTNPSISISKPTRMLMDAPSMDPSKKTTCPTLQPVWINIYPKLIHWFWTLPLFLPGHNGPGLPRPEQTQRCHLVDYGKMPDGKQRYFFDSKK